MRPRTGGLAEARALADVRGAVKGWAFRNWDVWPAYIERAEAEVETLPEALREAGDALVWPLRVALSKALAIGDSEAAAAGRERRAVGLHLRPGGACRFPCFNQEVSCDEEDHDDARA